MSKKYANLHVYCQWRTFLFLFYGTISNLFFQLCVVDNLNGVHCSEDSKCLMHEDKTLRNTINVGPGLKTQEWRRWGGWKRRSLEVSTSSSCSTSSHAPSTGNSHSQSRKADLCKVGDCSRAFGREPRSRHSGRSSENRRLAIPDGRSQDRAKVRMMWGYTQSDLIALSL